MAEITVDEMALRQLLYSQGFRPAGQPLTEAFSIPGSTEQVFKVCSKQDHSNCVFRVDPDQFS